jgi:16S rRNA (adenine1518-N6/adenine1519-N6)-dimethyltransferase
MDLFLELSNLVSRYRFYPKKGSGIYFIKRKELIEKIVDLLEPRKSDKFVEVNAGEFFVARELAKFHLTAFEERKDLIPLIQGELKIKLFSVPFLSFNRKLNANKCVSFLFSGNSNEILFKLFCFDFSLVVLLLRKDFAERILSEPGFSDYGALTVLADSFFEVKEVIEVKPDCFFPLTSSDFFLIKLKKKMASIKNRKHFLEFTRVLFRFKNKTFLSALNKALPLMELNKTLKNKIKKRMKEIEFNEKIYLMKPCDFIELFNFLIK